MDYYLNKLLTVLEHLSCNLIKRMSVTYLYSLTPFTLLTVVSVYCRFNIILCHLNAWYTLGFNVTAYHGQHTTANIFYTHHILDLIHVNLCTVYVYRVII